MAHVDRKQYMKIFGALVFLTALEVGVVYIPGISKTLLVVVLIGMAVTKAALVGIHFMHLGHEAKPMKLSVMIPFSAPAVYALVLIGDAAWRLVWPVSS
jgi:caa(3)-type oxidase subunit IV